MFDGEYGIGRAEFEAIQQKQSYGTELTAEEKYRSWAIKERYGMP